MKTNKIFWVLSLAHLNAYANDNLFDDLSFECDVTVEANGNLIGRSNKAVQPSSNDNEYAEGILDVTSDFKILKNDDHTGGIVLNFVLDKVVDKYKKRPELYKSYLYYIFDYIGEIRIGNDRNGLFYGPIIDGAFDNVGHNDLKNSSVISSALTDEYRFDKYCVGEDGIATKILWISPLVSGWKSSISFTPDADKIHFFSTNDKGRMKNIFSGVISYTKGDEDGFNWMACIGGNIGKSKKNFRSINSYLLGFGAGYKRFSADFNYINNKKSLASFDNNSDHGHGYKCNLLYKFDKFKIFCGGFWSQKRSSSAEKLKLKIKKIGFECDVNDLLTVVCEYRNIKTYTTTLKKLGDKHNVFIAEFKFKKLWNVF